jgi:hypothetical protein
LLCSFFGVDDGGGSGSGIDHLRVFDRDGAVSAVFCLEMVGTENAVLSVRARVSGLKCGVLVLGDHVLFHYLLVQA